MAVLQFLGQYPVLVIALLLAMELVLALRKSK
jgi:hypothetical protein